MRALFSILIAACLAAPARAGFVQTARGRVEGEVVVSAEGAAVGGKTVPWADVLTVLAEPKVRTFPRHEGLRLRNGEVWKAGLTGLNGKKVEFRSDLLGKHSVDLADAASLEFAADLRADPALRKYTLYREKGDPVPGTLLSLDLETIGVESLLGKTNLPRAGLVRYILDAAALANPTPPPPGGYDEVGLVDGSRVRGKLVCEAGELHLQHAKLGKLALRPAFIRSMVRVSTGAIDLVTAAPASAKTTPLISGTPDPTVRVIRGDGVGDSESHFVHALQIEPQTVVAFALPAGGKRTLRTVLAVVEAAKGDTKVRIRVGDAVVLERDVPADAKPQPLTLELPDGAELVIEVDFGPRLRFPCGVVFRDPLVAVQQ